MAAFMASDAIDAKGSLQFWGKRHDDMNRYIRPCDGDVVEVDLGTTLLETSTIGISSSEQVQAGVKLKTAGDGLHGESTFSPQSQHSGVSFGSHASSPAQAATSSRPLRRSQTGTSTVSTYSSIRAKDQGRTVRPNFRRSTSALSSLSVRTGATVKSSIPDGMDIGDLRGMSMVPMCNHWPINDVYDFDTQLGEGSFGQVWMAYHKDTQERYAIKRIVCANISEPERLEMEMKIFERLKNPYIVCLHEVYRDVANMHLVMELCMEGDLMEYLIGFWERSDDIAQQHLCKGLPWTEVTPLLWQMLCAVGYLHHHRFCHRDIKLENWMLKAKKPMHLLLCDFGLSTRINRGQRLMGACGSVMYMAPEVVSSAYGTKCDIWSTGVCGYVISTKTCPWGEHEDQKSMLSAIMTDCREGWPETDKPPALINLINQMMTFDEDDRPSAKTLFKTNAWLRKQGNSQQQPLCCSVM